MGTIDIEEKLGHDKVYWSIYEFNILSMLDNHRYKLDNCDPRDYCAVVAYDGKAYAISINDEAYARKIRAYENIPEGEEIPTVVKPISEMTNYFVLLDDYGENFVYGEESMWMSSEQKKLKEKLNSILLKQSTAIDNNSEGAKVLVKNKDSEQKPNDKK